MGTLNNGRGGTVGNAQYVGRTKWARAYYDFATDAGAIGAINLRGDKLPSGAIVLDTIVVGAVAVASAASAATVSIGLEAANDVRTAVVAGTAPAINGATSAHGAVTRATSALPLTADRHVVATIAAAAVTAGRFSVFVEYIEPASVV